MGQETEAQALGAAAILVRAGDDVAVVKRKLAGGTVLVHEGAEVRRRARPVAARDYWERGALRRYFSQRVFHAVLVERSGNGTPLKPAVRRELFDRMLAALDAGESLIIFPEGTRGTGETVAPFKAGIYHLAQHRPHLDFVPVFLHNLNRILPKGEVLPVPLIAQVTFGPPIRLQADEAKAAFLERARDALCRLQEI